MTKSQILLWSAGVFIVTFFAVLAFFGARPMIETELRMRAEHALADAGLSWLSVNLTGREATLEGAVFTPEDKERAQKAVRSVWGLSKVRSQLQLVVRDTPYVLRIQRRKDRLKLRGRVPSEKAHKAVLGLANAIFPGLEISARLQIDPNMPDVKTWLSGVGFALRQLTHLSQGSADLADTSLSLQGTAAKIGAYEEVMRAFQQKVPEGIFIRELDIAPPKVEPFTWQVQFKAGSVVLGGHIPSEMDQASLVSVAKGLFPDARIIDATAIASGAPGGWKLAARLALRALANLQSGLITISGTLVKIEGVANDSAAVKRISALEKIWPQGYKLQHAVRVLARSLPKRAGATSATAASVRGKSGLSLD